VPGPRLTVAQSSRLAEFGGLGMSFNICCGTLGSLAMFTAIRNASSRVSRLAVDRCPFSAMRNVAIGHGDKKPSSIDALQKAHALRRAGPRLLDYPMKNPAERGCSGGWGNRWRPNRSAAVKVVLVPLIGWPVLPAKFLKPSNEPRAGPLHSCSHGDLLSYILP
jgi:hypothetical protein